MATLLCIPFDIAAGREKPMRKPHLTADQESAIMPPNQDDKIREVSTPDTDNTPVAQPFNPTSLDFLSISTLSDYSSDDSTTSSSPIYETIELPQEPTLKELVQRSSNCDNVSELTKVKLTVIACDVSLQHLSYHTPILKELVLDGSMLSSLRDLGCGLKSLKILRVNRCGLTTLDGTFGLENLEEIYASKNKLTDISPCSNLTLVKIIDASKNAMANIDSLYFLSLCDNLTDLTLEGNECLISAPDYRRTVKELLPNLKTLDGESFNEDELPKIENNSVPSTSKLASAISEKKGGATCTGNSFVVTFPPKVLPPPRPPSSLPPINPRSNHEINSSARLPRIVSRQGSARI